MTITFDAVFENGTLRPLQPFPLAEHERVQVTIQPRITRARRTAGLMGWTGRPEVAEQFAMDPELEYPPQNAP